MGSRELAQDRITREQSLADEKRGTWVALERDRVTGFMALGPAPDNPAEASTMLTIPGSVRVNTAFIREGVRASGVGTALLREGIQWSKEQGYERTTTGFFAANLFGAPFWRSKGFKMLGLILQRTVDERILWASGRA